MKPKIGQMIKLTRHGKLGFESQDYSRENLELGKSYKVIDIAEDLGTDVIYYAIKILVDEKLDHTLWLHCDHFDWPERNDYATVEMGSMEEI